MDYLTMANANVLLILPLLEQLDNALLTQDIQQRQVLILYGIGRSVIQDISGMEVVLSLVQHVTQQVIK